MSRIERVRVRIQGRVQGVWFRASTQQTAYRLGVTGRVRNLPDGGVEAVFEGERAAVQAAVAWCAEGPEHATVSAVESFSEEPEGLIGFEIL